MSDPDAAVRAYEKATGAAPGTYWENVDRLARVLNSGDSANAVLEAAMGGDEAIENFCGDAGTSDGKGLAKAAADVHATLLPKGATLGRMPPPPAATLAELTAAEATATSRKVRAHVRTLRGDGSRASTGAPEERFNPKMGSLGTHGTVGQGRILPTAPDLAPVDLNNIEENLAVVRGFDWNYGDVDGGSGRIGHVVGWVDGDGVPHGRNAPLEDNKQVARVRWEAGEYTVPYPSQKCSDMSCKAGVTSDTWEYVGEKREEERWSTLWGERSIGDSRYLCGCAHISLCFCLC